MRAAIERYYDAILVYGPASSPDAIRSVGWTDLTVPVHHVGYLGWPMTDEPAPDLPDGYLLATVGGGHDGYRVLEEVLQAIRLEPLGCPTLVITGPLMPKAQIQALRSLAAGTDAQVVEFRGDMDRVLAGARAVVGMAGYNTVAETLRARRPALLVPRARPSQEQLVRARAVRSSRPTRCSIPTTSTPRRCATRSGALDVAAPDAPPDEYEGADRSARLLSELADPPRARRHVPHRRDRASRRRANTADRRPVHVFRGGAGGARRRVRDPAMGLAGTRRDSVSAPRYLARSRPPVPRTHARKRLPTPHGCGGPPRAIRARRPAGRGPRRRHRRLAPAPRGPPGRDQGRVDAREARRPGIVEPSATQRLLDGDPRSIAAIDRLVRAQVKTKESGIARVKLWDAERPDRLLGQPRLIGRRFDLPEEERDALRTGESEAELTDLSRAPRTAPTRCTASCSRSTCRSARPPAQRLLFELYQAQRSVTDTAQKTCLPFAPALIGALLLLQLAPAPARLSHGSVAPRQPRGARGAAAPRARRLGHRAPADRERSPRRSRPGPRGHSYALAAAADRSTARRPRLRRLARRRTADTP